MATRTASASAQSPDAAPEHHVHPLSSDLAIYRYLARTGSRFGYQGDGVAV